MSNIFENSPIGIEIDGLVKPLYAFPITNAPNLESVLESIGGLYIPGLHNFLPDDLKFLSDASHPTVDPSQAEYFLDILNEALSKDVFEVADHVSGGGDVSGVYPECVSIGPEIGFAYPLNAMKKIVQSDALHQKAMKAISDTLFGGMFHRTVRFTLI